MTQVDVLEILLYGKPVGTLIRVGGDRTLFSFNDDYIAEENRPVLGLSFKDQFGELIADFRPYRTKVPPFFSNLLPEGHLRNYLAERAGVNPVREFFLLRVLGSDLPGAVTVRSADAEDWSPDMDESNELDHRANTLRFSLAGVQLKFSAIQNARGGLTVPARGIGGSWIVKLPSREFEGAPENEFSMMTLARLIGMDVPAIQLVDINSIGSLPKGIGALKGQALAIARFDRLTDGSAVHIEDFAQVFGVYPDDKYRKGSARAIAKVIRAEGNEDDITEFIRRLTFSTLIGNADMHLKNWSLIYPDRRHASLAPAYDFLSTIAYIPDKKAAINFSRTKHFNKFSVDELSHLAAKADLPEKLVLDVARETVALFYEHWQVEKYNLPLSHSVTGVIEAHLKTIPIATGTTLFEGMGS